MVVSTNFTMNSIRSLHSGRKELINPGPVWSLGIFVLFIPSNFSFVESTSLLSSYRGSVGDQMEETTKNMIPQNQWGLFYFIMSYNGHCAKSGLKNGIFLVCFKGFNNTDFVEKKNANYYA